MAVYTHVSEEDLKNFLPQFDIGELNSFSEIKEGVENTNYLLEMTEGKFILTLVEKRVKKEDLPFFISFSEHLYKDKIPCPKIIENKEKEKINTLNDRPAIISSFLEGKSPKEIRLFHLKEIGKQLAKQHLSSKNFKERRENSMSFSTWNKLIRQCRDRADELEPGLYDFLQDELNYLRKNWPKNILATTIHADLFPDNVFFTKKELSGVIDFYFSCTDTIVYDLMLTLNAWCFDSKGNIDHKKAKTFLLAYEENNTLSDLEKESLTFFGRAAAMRIISTRLYDYLNPIEGAVVKIKDPMEYVQILKYYQAEDAEEDAS